MSAVKITINNERELTVPAEGSLYSALIEAGVFIPSACGGRGGCGLCRLKVVKGAEDQPFTRPETHWLSEHELAAGVRLSCQVKPHKDLFIELPPKQLEVKEYETEVVSLRDLTYDIKEVRLRLRNPQEMNFMPGQYVQVKIPAYELSRRPVFRAYSMANDPATKDELELEIRYVPNGISTTYIHKHLNEGDTLMVNGPHGDSFTKNSNRDLILIAGGSGMAPIKSMLLALARQNDPRRIRYFFGAKATHDLFLLDEMRALEKRLTNFRFIPALSTPVQHDGWGGETGLITDVVHRYSDVAANEEAYLCGSPAMIEACIRVLKSKGMSETDIYYDKFV